MDRTTPEPVIRGDGSSPVLGEAPPDSVGASRKRRAALCRTGGPLRDRGPPRLSERTQTQYGLAETTSESAAGENEGWGSRPTDEQSTSTESASSVDTTQSSFIGQATSDSAADEENEGNEGEDRDTTNPLFGDPESEELVGEEEETAVNENGLSPVQAGGVTVPDDELRRRGLTHDDIRFLTRILDVMNRDAPNHGLLIQ